MANSESNERPLNQSSPAGLQDRERQYSRLFRLNQTDAFLFLAISVWFVTLCTSAIANVDDYYAPISYLHALMIAGHTIAGAAGALLAFKRLSFARLVLVAAIFAIGAGVHFYSAGVLFSDSHFDELIVDRDRANSLGWMLSSHTMYWSIWIGVFLGACLTTYTARLLFKAIPIIKSWVPSVKIGRIKMLTGIAVVLFVLGTIQNILTFNNGGRTPELFVNSLPIDSRQGSRLIALVLGILCNIAVALAVFVPVMCIALSKWSMQKRMLSLGAIGIALVGAGVLIGIMNGIFECNFRRMTFYLGGFHCIPVFLLGLLCLAKPSQTPDSQPLSLYRLPSFWPIALLLTVTAGFAFLVNKYDVAQLLNASTGNYRVALKEAKLVADINRESGGAISRRTRHNSTTWSANVRGEHDKDLLSYPFDLSKPASLQIRNIQPFVDVSKLGQSAAAKAPGRGPLSPPGIAYVYLNGGQPTSKQLKDLSAYATSLGFANNVALPEKCEPGNELDKWTGIFGAENKYKPLASFLRSHLNVAGQQITVGAELKLEDWNALVDISQNRPVMILNTIGLAREFDSPKFVEDDLRPWSNITIQLQLHKQGGFELFERLLDVAETKEFNLAGFWMLEEKTKWAISFLMSGKGPTPDLTNLNQIPTNDFLTTAKEFGWIYEQSPNGGRVPRSIWLPESKLIPTFKNQLQSIKTLRLDVRGIAGMYGVGSMLVDAKHLSHIQGLEKLYLPTGVQFDHLKFLGDLANLKRLQIPAQDRTLHLTGGGFEQCKTLEELILLGTPDAKSIKELATLRNLKAIHVVDEQADFATDEEKSKLEQALPEIKISFIKPEDFKPFDAEAWKLNVSTLKKGVLNELRHAIREHYPELELTP